MIYLKKIIPYIWNIIIYIYEWFIFSNLQKRSGDNRFPLYFSNRLPAVWEKTKETKFDAHYVYHNAWALRVVRKISPLEHIDISSTVYFCSSLSAFIPTHFLDFRPAPLTLSDLEVGHCDLRKLPFADGTVQSISCMHTIEHVGLGRYGDSLDPKGDLKAFNELKRVVALGGSLLIVVPIGGERLCFNAHRIYSYESINSIFYGFELVENALITDLGEFLINPAEEVFDLQEYGCGCFWFRKKEERG